MRSTPIWHSRHNLEYRLKTKFRRKQTTLQKKMPPLSPFSVETKTLAVNWWAKNWNAFLKNYTNRALHLEKGKLHFRCEALADLKIEPNHIQALVLGSLIKPYEVDIQIGTLAQTKWTKIQKLHGGDLESFEKILDHRFPKRMSDIFSNKPFGLFPSLRELTFQCSCSDTGRLCKHIATVLYGVGGMLDKKPELIFQLRGVDIHKFMSDSIHKERTNILKTIKTKTPKKLKTTNLSEIFNLALQSPSR